MWHFGKGQALRLCCPSIFITSPLVIWKLASPIFVSPMSPAVPVSLAHVLISSFSLRLGPLCSRISVAVVPVMPPLASRFVKCSFFLLTRRKLALYGIRNPIFHTHHANVQKPGGVQGPHVNTSCKDYGDREKG